MIALPWYLLSAGAIALVVGLLINGMSGSRDTFIDPRMSDEEIAEQMQSGQPNPIGTLLIFVGGLLMMVSIVWRIARALS